MLGAIAGDVIGSVHEHSETKTKHFPLIAPGCRFTDDTVLTIAVASAVLDGTDYIDAFHTYFASYPRAGYGLSFIKWASSRDRAPYNSWGNGSAMRVSAIGFAFDTLEEVLVEAKRSAAVTHSHPEGVRGAQATAAAILLARQGHTKDSLRRQLEQHFAYDLQTPLDVIRPGYRFDVSCQGSVPQAIIAFLESTDYEDAVRNAISLGGDADTMACIAGGIAEAFYGEVPSWIRAQVVRRLAPPLCSVLSDFESKFGNRGLGSS